MTYQAKIRRTQGASALEVASGGTIDIQPGGSLNIASGALTLPPGLKRGFIPLDIFSARVLSSGEGITAFNVTATGAALPAANVGGLMASGTVPSLTMNSTVSQAAVVTWASGESAYLAFSPVMVPQDWDSATAWSVHCMGERASDAASNVAFDFRAYLGLGTTDMGTTGATISTVVGEYSAVIASGASMGHPNFINIQIAPGSHPNNAVRMYDAWVEYARKSS